MNMYNFFAKGLYIFLLALTTAGCAAFGTKVTEQPTDAYLDGISGVGLESQDIDKMIRQIVKEILALNLNPSANDSGAPRIIIDSQKIINESGQIINTTMLADRLRVGLLREAQGNLVFISRENSDAVINEAKLSGTLDLIPADYRLVGKITSLSSYSEKTGVRSNFVQVSFELLDLKTAALVWGNIYEVKKVGADDTIYR